MKRRTLLVATGLVVAIAAAVFAWQQRVQPPDPAPLAPATEAAAGAVPAGRSPDVRAEAARPPPAPSPLPPANAPLAQILPGLKAAADAGDRRAACRLGMELLRCEGLGAWDALVDYQDSEATYAAEGNLAAANAVAERVLRRKEQKLQCRGVDPAMQGEGARYLRQAALAGDPYAMVAYAEGQHWPPSTRGVALGREFDLWRQEAPGMMHAALRAGNPSAAYILQLNYGDDFGFLSALIPDDPYQGLVHHLLAVRLFGFREHTRFALGLDAAEIERARREAAAMHARYFDGRSFPRNWAMQYAPYMGTGQRERRDFCQLEP